VATRAGVSIEGIDTLVPAKTAFAVRQYDGLNILYPDDSFDTVMFVDVLHHIPNRILLSQYLAEAVRVARLRILIKDHIAENSWGRRVRRFMDRVGNSRFGVVSPGNYLTKAAWAEEFSRHQWKVEQYQDFSLYCQPLEVVFGGRLQVVFSLSCAQAKDHADEASRNTL
jgi:hypothetical protein